jgi:D(-)-tartrate dehydratase
MRIIEIREKTVPIASAIANAYIDFSKMTCSLVAVVTDVHRNGNPVVGYGFNSNGRYGQGASSVSASRPGFWRLTRRR